MLLGPRELERRPPARRDRNATRLAPDRRSVLRFMRGTRIMAPIISAAAAEFLENFQRDAPVRWSADDLGAQREFVNAHISGRDWLDWSTPAAALDLVQSRAPTAPGATGGYHAVLLAGPVVELLDPETLFTHAMAALSPGCRVVGVIPCLRDNSPESRLFAEYAAADLWRYCTAEELLEILRETEWTVDPEATGFFAVRRFNEAVLGDELGFKGFNRVFTRLAAEGYDPMEVGFGELRFVARSARE
jgi:hypothetical protein